MQCIEVRSTTFNTASMGRLTRVHDTTCRAWAQIAGLETCPAVACIGSTSAKAAKHLGIADVYSPQRPGMDGFLDSIMEALDAAPAASAA